MWWWGGSYLIFSKSKSIARIVRFRLEGELDDVRRTIKKVEVKEVTINVVQC